MTGCRWPQPPATTYAMNSITFPLADALNALARLYPTDAATLNEAADKLRELAAETQRLRDAGRDENSRLLVLRGQLASAETVCETQLAYIHQLEDRLGIPRS
jgi:hypothetical protein